MKEVKRMHKILLGLLTVETTVQIFFQGLSEAIEIIRMTYSDITIKNKFAAAAESGLRCQRVTFALEVEACGTF